MEQNGEEDKTIFTSADFQKFPIKDKIGQPVPKPVYNIHNPMF